MKITLTHGDITTLKVDAIVNAANSSLLGGSGVDGAIHRKAGAALREACIHIRNTQGKCATGEAVITTGGNLDAQYVIHTVGPIWKTDDDAEKYALQLRRCYTNSLKLADARALKSIAFPNISTGVYRFPKALAADIALQAVSAYENTHIEEVIFVCYDEENHAMYLEKIGQYFPDFTIA